MKPKQLFIAAIAASPLALAAIGFDPMDTVLRMIADFFTFDALQNDRVQEGVIRFALFILYFAIANFSLKKFFDKKTAGIASFIFAFLGIFLMPEQWVKLTGGTISVIVGGGLILSLLGGLIYFAMIEMNDNWVEHLLGILILLAVAWLIIIYVSFTGIPADILSDAPGNGASTSTSSSSSASGVPMRSWEEITNDKIPPASEVNNLGPEPNQAPTLSESTQDIELEGMEYIPPSGGGS